MHRKVLTARNRIIVMFIIILILSFGVYGTYVTYNVYDNIMENNYKNLNLMIDVTIENLKMVTISEAILTTFIAVISPTKRLKK